MKSRITVEVDFDNNNQPVLQILQYPDSDDVRDKLLTHFCQQFGGSSWCKIQWKEGQAPYNRIVISPIKPEELKDESAVMLEQHTVYENWMQGRERTEPEYRVHPDFRDYEVDGETISCNCSQVIYSKGVATMLLHPKLPGRKLFLYNTSTKKAIPQ